jgi:hypothetical protein
MAEPADSTPPTAKFKPPELPAVQLWHPKKPQRKLTMWQWAAIILLTPWLILFTAVGAYTCTKWAFRDPPAVVNLAGATPTPAHTQPPQYDLPAYEAVIGGSAEKTYADALWGLRADIKGPDRAAARIDAPRLTNAASTLLALIQQTNPPPAYATEKAAYLRAVNLGLKAGETIQQALSTGSLTLWQRGANQATRARALLTKATATATPTPTDTPIGS